MIDLVKLKELLARASDAPWSWGQCGHALWSADSTEPPLLDTAARVHISDDNAELIAAARNQLPELIALIEDARELLGAVDTCRTPTLEPGEFFARADAWIAKTKS